MDVRPTPVEVVEGAMRHYLEIEHRCAMTGDYTIVHADMQLSFTDLKGCLRRLPKRHRTVIYHAVVRDQPDEVAARKARIKDRKRVRQIIDSAMAKVAAELYPEGIV